MNLFWLLGAFCIKYCNYTAIIILQLGLDFWVLSPQPIRFGLNTENLRIKPGSMYDRHQLKSGLALNSGHVVNLDKDCLRSGLQNTNGLAGSQSYAQHGTDAGWYHRTVFFQSLFLVFSHLCTGRLRELHRSHLIPRHSADQTAIKGKFWLQIDSENLELASGSMTCDRHVSHQLIFRRFISVQR